MTSAPPRPVLGRRAFLTLLGAGMVAVARHGEAQAPPAPRRLGILTPHAAPSPEQRGRDFVARTLKELGWIEGQNLVVESAYGEGRDDRLPQLADRLADRGVDVIWAVGAAAAVAAARATRTIPIVFWGVSAPVELGLINRLARPGGNVTGAAWSPGGELFGKQLEFIKQSAPGTTRVAWITTPSVKGTVSGSQWAPSLDVLEEPARRLGLEIRRHALQRSEDLDAILASALAWRAQAIVTSATPLSWRERERIAEFARRHRLLVTADMKDFADAGALMSYAPDVRETVRRSLAYVDRILRGGRPADLPVEQPPRLQLVINLKTANALGLTIPPPLLVRADHVIR
jgi:putative ABC transport system substrate-binding protein